jgi:signal transduction histidine kinase
MTSADHLLARRPRVLVATSLAVLAALLAADLLLRAALSSSQAPSYGLVFEVGFGAFAAASAIAGAVIVTRQRRNVIGWLLLVIPLWAAFGFVAGDYATYALVRAPGALPFGRAAAWIDRWAIVPMLSLPILLFLLFPDGHVPSRRWRPVLWLACVAPAVTTVLFAATPGRMTGAFAQLSTVRVINPTGIPGTGGVMPVLSEVTGLASLLAAVLAGAALIARFRSRHGDERQQIKWLAFVGATFLAELALTQIVVISLGDSSATGDAFGNLMFAVMFLSLGLGIPAACAVAILKYRLYDIDVVISKTVVYAVLAAFITAVYVLLVVGVGTLAGLGGRPSPGLSILATAVVAVAFQPVRERVQRLANRLVYGKRATPYEALAQLSERMAGTYATEDLLPRMALIVAAATGADRADVWLRDGDVLRADASWPAGAEPPSAVPLAGGELPAATAAGHLVAVRHRGELLGALSVAKKRGDAVTPTEDRLIGNLATQAGLVLRNAGLTEQLLARLAELRASRERLVTTQDTERQRLERDLRDGPQRELAGLAGKLGDAAHALGHDEARARALLNEVTSEIAGALASLRELARGIYPPLLADMGIAAALDAQARKAPIPVSVETDGIGRYPEEIEAAVYFCALEALRSAAWRAGASRAALRFEVTGDGQRPASGAGPWDADLQAMADRVDALGGEILVAAAPGQGTRINGRVPVPAMGLPVHVAAAGRRRGRWGRWWPGRAAASPCGRRPPPRRTSGAARLPGRTAPARAAATPPPPGPGRRSCPRTPAAPARAGRGCSCGR